MKQLLNGKRIFVQESDETRYLLFNESDIHNYYYFYEEVAIKKGDILYPQKWVKYTGSTLIKSEDFSLQDYEYIFILDKWVEKDIQNVLKPFLDPNDPHDSILTLNNLHEDAEQMIRKVLEKEAYKEDECMVVEAYAYPSNEKRFIILNSEVTDDEITDECTRYFKDTVILATYHREKGKNIEYLYKTVPQKSYEQWRSNGEQRWFHSMYDPTNSFIVLKQIYDIEDMLPFTNLKLG